MNLGRIRGNSLSANFELDVHMNRAFMIENSHGDIFMNSSTEQFRRHYQVASKFR